MAICRAWAISRVRSVELKRAKSRLRYSHTTLDDVVDGHLLLVELHVDFQNLLGQRRSDLASGGTRRWPPAMKAPLRSPARWPRCCPRGSHHVVRNLSPSFCALADDFELRLVVRCSAGTDSPHLKTRQQPLFDVFQLHGRFVRGVSISCLPASCRWLKMLKNAFCVPVFPVSSWMSSMMSTSIIW